MSAHTEQRKLAAIMFTDMVGYSALSQRNEALALELLEEHRGVLRGLFPKHQGTEIKTSSRPLFIEPTTMRCFGLRRQSAAATALSGGRWR